MKIKKKLYFSIIFLILALIFSFISCSPDSSSSGKVEELQKELESKNQVIRDLDKELKAVKEDLQRVQGELDKKLAEEAEEKIEEEPKAPQEFRIGDEILFLDSYTGEEVCSVIIHSVENYTDYDKYSAPDEGRRLAVLDVEIQNLSDEVHGYNGLNYALRDADSYRYDNAAWGGKEPRLGAGDLAPGDKMRGWVTLDIPDDITMVEILASPCYCDPPAVIKLVPPLTPES